MDRPRRKRRKAGQVYAAVPRVPLVRIAPAALASLLLAALVIAVSGAAVVREASPAAALMVAPWDAKAKARLAELSLASAEQSPAQITSAADLARSALGRDATIASAWRILGIAAGAKRDSAQASALMHIAGTISRRDLPTQTWLIEERVQANDIPGALKHYDIALRSSPAAANLLIPILVQASSDPAVAKNLSILLMQRPPWRDEFLYRLADAPSGDMAASLVERAASVEARPLPDSYLALASRFIDKGKYEAGLRVLHVASGDKGPIALLRNGGFDRENPYPPYQWRITDAANPVARIAPVPGRSGNRLEISATAGNGGLAAEQLLLLPPGSYRLSAVRGTQSDVAPGQLQLRIECTGTGVDVSNLMLAEGRSANSFDIPSEGCPAQWIRISLLSDFSASDIGGWVDDVSIAKQR